MSIQGSVAFQRLQHTLWTAMDCPSVMPFDFVSDWATTNSDGRTLWSCQPAQSTARRHHYQRRCHRLPLMTTPHQSNIHRTKRVSELWLDRMSEGQEGESVSRVVSYNQHCLEGGVSTQQRLSWKAVWPRWPSYISARWRLCTVDTI